MGRREGKEENRESLLLGEVRVTAKENGGRSTKKKKMRKKEGETGREEEEKDGNVRELSLSSV